jgi:hypothetical protein
MSCVSKRPVPATMKGWRATAGAHPPGSLGARAREADAGAEFREAIGERGERHRVGRDRAAIDPHGVHRVGRTREILKRLADGFLHRVLAPHIAPRVLVESAGEADETRMLARAIVVERTGLGARNRQSPGRGFAHGPVGAAFEAIPVLARLGEHGGGGLGVSRLAGMGGAGERDLRIGEPEPVGDAAFHQRQHLKPLHGRAREDGVLPIAQREHGSAIRIDHLHGAAMARLHLLPTGDLDENRIVHECLWGWEAALWRGIAGMSKVPDRPWQGLGWTLKAPERPLRAPVELWASTKLE